MTDHPPVKQKANFFLDKFWLTRFKFLFHVLAPDQISFRNFIRNFQLRVVESPRVENMRRNQSFCYDNVIECAALISDRASLFRVGLRSSEKKNSKR